MGEGVLPAEEAGETAGELEVEVSTDSTLESKSAAAPKSVVFRVGSVPLKIFS